MAWSDFGSNAQQAAQTIMDPVSLGKGGVRNGQNPNNPGKYFQNWGANALDSIMGTYNGPTHTTVGAPVNSDYRAVTAAGQSGGPDMAQDSQSRAMQMGLMQQLQNQANGQGPSLAQMQLQKGTDQNMANAMALSASQRGAGNAGMMRNIQSQQAGIGQGMANDSAMMRLQEQMQARGMLGQGLQGMRGQDQSMAGMGLQNNQFNTGQYNNMQQFNVGQYNQMANEDAQRKAAAQQLQAQLDMKELDSKQKNAHDSSMGPMIGSIIGAVA